MADGMGGHTAGELAAQLALSTFCSAVEHQRGPLPQRAVYAAERANQTVYRRAVGELSGMGTTLLAGVVSHGALHLVHIGDSRAYLLRNEALYRLTDDHSWVADQLRAGLLTLEQSRTHRWRNVVSNALGGEERVRLELLSLALEPGDRLLLCTDGLHGPVSEHKLLTVLSLPHSPERAARMLINLANQAGGPDNVSAVVVDVLTPGPRSSRRFPGRGRRGPVPADQLLTEVNQGTPLNYLLLGVVYLILLLLALLPIYRAHVALVGLTVLGGLMVFARHFQGASDPVLRPESRITLAPSDSDSWPGAGPLHAGR